LTVGGSIDVSVQLAKTSSASANASVRARASAGVVDRSMVRSSALPVIGSSIDAQIGHSC
jgi:hypothetical protein